MIRNSFIQDLLNRVDIVDVVGQHVSLKKAGANYVACCPFHNEKSPSFTVSPTKQFYHCFGCGAHGTAIGFAMEHLGLGFVEAVETLARQAGMEVQYDKPEHERGERTAGPALHELMLEASRYYRTQLKAHPQAIEYLKQRGVSGEIARAFGIGYAPGGWQNLGACFPDYARKELAEIGLVIDSEEGRRYDRFRDRIMFPIVNGRGQVIGFGGRVLGKGEPKYLNSPETPLFEKGRELYGLFQAQKTIRAQSRVLVVEGYMDVVALAQQGIGYAVATLGTATTAFHVQRLLRLAEQVVFCFDGDTAGRKAAWRALENALPYLQDGKQLRFLFLPPEHDPDSFVRAHGKAAFEQLVDEAMVLSSYLLREIGRDLDLRTAEGRDSVLQRARPLLTAIQAPTTALLLRKEVAALAGIAQQELEALFEIRPAARVARAAPPKQRRARGGFYRRLLQCLIARPDFAPRLPLEGVSGQEGDVEAVLALASYLREQAGEAGSAALLEHFQGSEFERALVEAQVEMLDWGEAFDVEAEFAGLVGKLAEAERRAHFQALQEKLQHGGLSSLSEEERALYLTLLRPADESAGH